MTHPNDIRILIRRLAFAALAAACLTALAPARAQTVLPGTINGGIVRPGTVAPSALVSGGTTPSSANFYRGDGTWQAVTGGYTLPIASSTILGGVKIGSGILEAGDGTISVTASSVGGAYTGAAPITVTGTSIGVNQASATNFGVMEVGAGLQAASGVVGLQSVITGNTFAYPSSLAVDNYGRVTAITAGAAPGAGTVTSVSASSSVPGITATVTTAATTPAISLTATAGQPMNQFLATPSGASGALALRALAKADEPSVGTAGTYGDATHFPVITTDAQGHVSGVSVQAVTGGGGGGISYLSTDPASPSTGAVWYNSSVHKLKVKEASAVYASVFSPDAGKPAAGSIVDTSASIASGLVLSYPLNESGSSITDRSSTNDTGTIYSSGGVATTTGFVTDSTYTTALAFNTSSVGYAANSHASALNIETLTVALAFKTSATSATQVIFYQGQNTTSTSAIEAQVYITASGVVGFACQDSTSNSYITSAASTYADGNWHSVVATRTRHGAMTLNVDSATQVTGTDGTTNTTSTTSLTTLGARPASSGTAVTALAFTGSIAYVNVWNVVLTSTQIMTIQSDPFAMYR